jgi:ribosomal protein L7/L12
MDSEISGHFRQIAQAIARLERKTDFILKELNLEYIDTPESSISPQLAEVYALLQQGKKMQAIQAYRKQTDVGYEEAKIAVDNIERGSRPG